VAKTPDDLYGLPLEEFTEARNDLARELSRQGDREKAEAVRQLRKPSVPVWAINQLARRRGDEVQQLLDLEDDLRRAHGESEERFRDALAAERRAVAELVQETGRILAESGQPGSQATLDRVTSTLPAAAADPQHREALAAGRLTEELEPPGFEALAGMKLPKRKEPARRPSPDRPKKPDRDAVRAARDEARRLEREALRAEKAAREARDRAEKARAKLDALQESNE
jgi:hypothetical protein